MAETTVVRRERGWPGHFIAAHDCAFRRNTLVSRGDQHIVVSTVGDYQTSESVVKICGPNPQMIGWHRHYETMAFRSKSEDLVYHDANVSRPVSFESEWSLRRTEENKDTVDNLADEMHERVVAEIMADFDRAWMSAEENDAEDDA